jgi:hypothetical protein
MRSVIGNQQYALLSSIAAQVDAQMESRKVLLASLADTMPPAAASDPAAMQAFIDRHPVARQQFLNLHISIARVLLPRTTPSRATRPVLAICRKTVVPYKSEITGLPSIMILHPVRDARAR